MPPTAQSVNFTCLSCPAGYYCDRMDEKPKPCGIGWYQNLTMQTSCSKCPKGTFSNYAARDMPCEKCRPGTYQPSEGQTGCLQCGGGTYQPDYGASTECIPCDVGKYQPATMSTACVSCPLGYAASEVPVSPADSLGKACDYCAEGKYTASKNVVSKRDGSTLQTLMCMDCPNGKYAPYKGQAACMECSSPVTGAMSMYLTTASTGSTSPDECICDPGASYLDDATGECTPCITCGRGTYIMSSSGSSTVCASNVCMECRTCPANNYINPAYVCNGTQSM
jgi:hypothetical protein